MDKLQIPPSNEKSSSIKYEIISVSYEDAFVDEDFEKISELADTLTNYGFHGNSEIDLERERPATQDMSNLSTIWLHENLPGYTDWRETVPTSGALSPLYNPSITKLANGKDFTPEMSVWMRNLYDGIGIRSRAKAMQEIIVKEVISNKDKASNWVSLGSGAADPVFASLEQIKEQGGLLPNTVLVDLYRGSLEAAQSTAESMNIQDSVQVKRMNILGIDGIDYVPDSSSEVSPSELFRKGKLAAGSFDMVDAVGVLEYLQDEDSRYAYGKEIDMGAKKAAGAERFLRNAYRLVKPGGLLVVGNMRETHPQLGFTLNVVQWPHVQPRSIETMMGVIEKAGITDPEIEVYCPDDEVYAVYAIRKSL